MNDIFIHKTAIVDQPADIGSATTIWHWVHVMSGAKIGEGCVLGQNVYVGGKAVLGNNVRVQNNVSIYDRVILADDVFCGPSMVFTNVINPRSSVDRKDEYIETYVGKGASIGANATIICGNNIGEYAFIGAGSVVTKPVPAYALMVGNPAKQIGWISRVGLRLEFDDEGVAICGETRERYKKTENITVYLGNKT
ncbi:MAG: N-acetyltransferase [Balneola sp.]|nr:N-acetyltransferase [Balneola sp.]|tara:strand:+ start:1187 stop:1771 length:585 start_codon:yes stop_codon:yes gene_type:complete